MSFVRRVESRKKFRRDPGIIIRHLFEEIGECSRALWFHQEMATPGLKEKSSLDVAMEIVDIVSVSMLLADVLGVDINKAFPVRFRQVGKQYGVRFAE